ncbi:MAG TPA: cytochrome P450 [Gemmatimonadales bacterium]|nr:cytochrome P450 [Gemmatimonadales bacterium]
MTAPSPAGRGLPLLGHLPWFYADTNGFLLRLARSQGDIATFRLGRDEAFLLSHPDHVRQVLVEDADRFRKGRLMQRARRVLGDGLLTSEEPLHHEQRRRLQLAFCSSRLDRYGEIVAPFAARTADRWTAGRAIDVGDAMDELAMAIVVRTLLGADTEGDAAPLAADLRVLSRWLPLLAVPGARWMEHTGLPPFRGAGQAADRLHAAVHRCIDGATPAGDRDLLSVLLRPGADGTPMPPGLARDEAMTLFLAGRDTTAAVLTWTWYLLAAHPEVDQRLGRELEEVLGDRDPAPADCPALGYTGMVLDEALRLYPPAGRIGRRPVAEYCIGGRRISAGAAVFLSPFVTQRDPRWWPDPERFDPGRWSEKAARGRPPYAAFPFGAGPRTCIGARMARDDRCPGDRHDHAAVAAGAAARNDPQNTLDPDPQAPVPGAAAAGAARRRLSRRVSTPEVLAS